ncbi:MAG: DUF6122 family protein [Aquisalimonadaceae bacterium]
MTLAAAIHILLHIAVPGAVAVVFFRSQWRSAWLIMLAAMVVDLDHLLADPIYDPNRCSIGFHPLHGYPAIGAYAAMTIPKATRLIGTGLLIHMGLDWLDCLMM